MKSFALTAIEELARMEHLGIPFLSFGHCFHYLLPVADPQMALDPKQRYYILSCLYSPLTKAMSTMLTTPLESALGWERKAFEITRRLEADDPDQGFWY